MANSTTALAVTASGGIRNDPRVMRYPFEGQAFGWLLTNEFPDQVSRLRSHVLHIRG